MNHDQSVVSFQSQGMIDYRCITTVGASIKEGENPIGYFGTGLKYAIAIVLRQGGLIDIYRGLERLRFETKDVEIRGKMFKVVCMNGKEMGFTTELGKNWLTWQAFREIYCNTTDENGRMELGRLRPQPGTTTVVVELYEFAQCARRKQDYILEAKPIHSGEKADFHQHTSTNLYYRTILVKENWPKPWRFTVNLKGDMELTEDRTLKSTWGTDNHIAKSLNECHDETFLEQWLSAGEDFAEHNVDIVLWTGTFNPLITKIGEKLYRDPLTYEKLNTSLRSHFRNKQGEAMPEAVAVLLPSEQEVLNDAVEWCKSLGYMVDEYPIIVAETLGESILGRAFVQQRKIYISREALLRGQNCIVGTLIEEWVHIKHRHVDCSRGLQNWLLDNVVRLGSAYIREVKKQGGLK